MDHCKECDTLRTNDCGCCRTPKGYVTKEKAIEAVTMALIAENPELDKVRANKMADEFCRVPYLDLIVEEDGVRDQYTGSPRWNGL